MTRSIVPVLKVNKTNYKTCSWHQLCHSDACEAKTGSVDAVRHAITSLAATTMMKAHLFILLEVLVADGFTCIPYRSVSMTGLSPNRRQVLMASSFLGGIIGGNDPARAKPSVPGAKGPTNEIIKVVNGMRHRRLGGSDIVVSELGLGTQRWLSTDFNAPNEELCFDFMDRSILLGGVNLLDTAEQYPIPSDDRTANEGDTERVIGKWLKERKVPREQVVIATKITGGRNITPMNIKADCKATLSLLICAVLDSRLSQARAVSNGSRPITLMCTSFIGHKDTLHSQTGVSRWPIRLRMMPTHIGVAWVARRPLKTCAWPCKA